jgi:DNA-binding MarR family transcriptional regulator
MAGDVVDAVIGASRVLVAVAARSLSAAGEDVTLPQYRALVVLASRGPTRVADLAAELDVNSSTATRMCDRLVTKRLITRERDRDNNDRRIVYVAISDAGHELVAAVTRKRRAEVRSILRRMPAQAQAELVTALRQFSASAGEVPEQHWSLGWTT